MLLGQDHPGRCRAPAGPSPLTAKRPSGNHKLVSASSGIFLKLRAFRMPYVIGTAQPGFLYRAENTETCQKLSLIETITETPGVRPSRSFRGRGRPPRRFYLLHSPQGRQAHWADRLFHSWHVEFLGWPPPWRRGHSSSVRPFSIEKTAWGVARPPQAHRTRRRRLRAKENSSGFSLVCLLGVALVSFVPL